MQPSVLVTGGAGFLGINLCRHLLGHGCNVRSMDITAFDYPERQVIDVMQADIRDSAAVERACCEPRERPEPTATYEIELENNQINPPDRESEYY